MHALPMMTAGIALIVSTLGSVQAQEPAEQSASAGTDSAIATFAGGCFWCMEPPYDKLEGVSATTAGYIGGSVPDPSYEQVSSGGTGHAEAVQITYDPQQVSYGELLDVFWRNIDPVDDGGQFYAAEEYHQNYYEKNPIRYRFYRWNCGRGARLEELWGSD